jgi:hypothetical protein
VLLSGEISVHVVVVVADVAGGEEDVGGGDVAGGSGVMVGVVDGDDDREVKQPAATQS